MRRNLTNEEIEIYFSMKLSHSLPENELAFLNNLIEEDPELKARWIEFCEHFRQEDIENRFAKLDEQGKWKALNPASLQVKAPSGGGLRKLVSNKTVYIYAAAIFVGLFISIRLLSPRKAQSTIKTLAKQEEFVLKLADGQVIDLSKLTGNQAQGISFDSKQNLLSFDSRRAKPGIATLKVPAGRSLSVQLSDGSTMVMNSFTEVSFPLVFDERQRKIAVKGEVYFSVSKDPTRPFMVETPSGAVQVLGTEFNLNSYGESAMKVTLVSGSVKVVTAKSQLTLKPGSTAVTDENHKISLSANKDDHALSWKKGIYYFENSNVQEIRDILGRWYNLNVEIDNTEILNQRFTGPLDRASDVSIFLANLAAVTTIKYAIDEKGDVHLR